MKKYIEIIIIVFVFFTNNISGCGTIKSTSSIDLEPIMGEIEEQSLAATQNFAIIQMHLEHIYAQQEKILVALQQAGIPVEVLPPVE